MINRRNVVIALGAGGLAPRVSIAQQTPDKIFRIGYCGPSSTVAPGLLDAFRDGLRERGYIEGKNLAIEYRYTDGGGNVLLQTQAAALVARQVAVIAVSVANVAVFARKATETIPIVMLNGDDPVENGLAASLGRPGGNVTGVVRLSSELIPKNLELLSEIVPGAKRMALLVDPDSPVTRIGLPHARRAAQVLGVELGVVEARSAEEIDLAFATLSKQRPGALVVTGSGRFFVLRAKLAALALKMRLPSVFAFTEQVEAGGLAAYSASSVENYRHAATFVDRILRGAKPADLPIEQPTKFELAVNMKTARALGVKIPQSVLVRVTRVIE